jgi:hypothetical protein
MRLDLKDENVRKKEARPMTLEELSFISQIVAAIAIVVSLIYVAVQLRQTERNQRAAMQLTYAGRIIDGGHRAAEPHMADVIAKVVKGETSLTDREMIQLMQLADTIIAMFDDTVWQRKAKLLDDTHLDNMTHVARAFFAWPAARAVWHARKAFIAPHRAELIEKTIIQGVPLSAPVDIAARWREAVAAIEEGRSP